MFVEKIQCFEFGGYRLDVTNNQLLKDETPVSITQKSFEILLFLIENQGIVVKKEEILDSLWEGDFVEESTLTQHIYMLRKALRQNGKGEIYIETIPKIGYRFIADVAEVFYENPHIHTSVYPDQTASVSEPVSSGIVYFKAPAEPAKNFVYEDRRIAGKYLKKRFSGKPFLFAVLLIITLISALGYLVYQRSFATNAAIDEKAVTQIRSIAVLPFRQIGGTIDEKLGLGMADVLISKLGRMEGVSVRPTSSIIRFADTHDEDLFDIGRKLNVDAILIGTIQRESELIRINVQLYRISDQRQICAEQFDEKYSNIFSVQDRISGKIAQKLFLQMNVREESLAYLEYTNSTAAYQAYSMGLFHWNKRSEESLQKAIEYFSAAIEQDPKFTHAYAYLADSYTLVGYYRMKMLPPEKALALGKEMARKALELDENCSEALTTLATIYFIEDKPFEGVKLLEKALEINPNNSTARLRLGWNLVFEGKLEKAVEQMKIAQILDPLSLTTNIALAQVCYLTRRPDEAINYSKLALEIDSNSTKAREWLANAYEQKGLYRESAGEFRKLADDKQRNALLGLSRVYAKDNKKAESKKILKNILTKPVEKLDEDELYSIALNQLALGETAEALIWLKKFKEARTGNFPRFRYDYQLDPLRGNPDFEKFNAQARTR